METNSSGKVVMPVGLALGILRLAEQCCSLVVEETVPEVFSEKVEPLEDREVSVPINLLEALSVLIGEWKDPADKAFYQSEIKRMIAEVKRAEEKAKYEAAGIRTQQIDDWLAGGAK